MGSQHIAAELIEANKKISKIIDTLENSSPTAQDRQIWIDDLNTVISRLDHIVEDLEKNR